MPADSNRQPVVIVGAGPVGMVLALDLAQRGVRSVLVNTGEYSRLCPKGNGHNARTMEHYRRLGIAKKIRSVGLRPDQPADVTYFTRIAEHRLARIPLPSSRDAQAAAAGAPVTDQVPEPLHRGNQMYVERVLYDEVRRNEKVGAALRLALHGRSRTSRPGCRRRRRSRRRA